MSHDFNKPEDRAAYIEAHGVDAYNEEMTRFQASQLIETCNGYKLAYVQTRFGRLVSVQGTLKAFDDLEKARKYANSLPAAMSHEDRLRARLQELKDQGLTFTDCVKAFGVERDTDAHGKAAFERWHKDGEIEVDDTTVISESSDNGAYVLAWVWVDDPGDEEDE